MPWTFFGRTYGNNTNSPAPPPSTPTLAVADNADGTGVTATVAGSDAGSSNTVYAVTVAPGPAVPAWVSKGTRVGDGTVSVSLSPGYYFFYCLSTVAAGTAASAPLMAAATSSNQSVLDRVLGAVLAVVKTLSLPTITSIPPAAMAAANIVRFDHFNENVLPLLQLPSIVVAAGVSVQFPGLTTQKDDVGYPVWVVLVDRGAPQNLVPFPTWELWAERISRGLRNQPLVGVPEVGSVRPEPYAPFSWSGPENTKGYDTMFCAQPFRAVSREVRGA